MSKDIRRNVCQTYYFILIALHFVQWSKLLHRMGKINVLAMYIFYKCVDVISMYWMNVKYGISKQNNVLALNVHDSVSFVLLLLLTQLRHLRERSFIRVRASKGSTSRERESYASKYCTFNNLENYFIFFRIFFIN